MKTARGFSLMELMIAVAIIGILTAVAYPSYQKSVIKTYRGNAKAFLLDVAQREQQYLMDKRAYVAGDTTTTANATALTAALGVAIPTEFSRYYTVTITAPAGAPPTFLAKANPISGTKQFADGWIAIDQAGTKTSQNPDKW